MKFVDSLTNNIKSRFPENDLLSNFSVLAMRPLSFLPPKQLEDFGNEEIKSLCELYGSEQTVTWKQDGEEHTKTSQPLIDSQKAFEEWKMLKKVVLAEQYATDCMWQLWKAIVTFHGKEFPNVTIHHFCIIGWLPADKNRYWKNSLRGGSDYLYFQYCFF